MDEEMELGCLGSGEEATDYLLCDGDIDVLPKLVKQDDIRFEYNQQNQEWSRKSCTIFSAIGMVSDLKNYEFPLEEIKEIDELSYKAGRIRGEGRYVKNAVDLVRKYWNENHSDLGKIAYYRVSKHSEIFDEILDNNYSLNGNFCPTAEYSQDYRKDAMLDGKDFGTQKNGHAIDIIHDGRKGIAVKDSYKGRKTYDGTKDCNIYGLKHRVADLSNYGIWFYLYTNVAEDNFEEINRLNKIKSLILQGMPINSELRHLTNSSPYKDRLHDTNDMFRQWLDYINLELKRLN